MPNNTRRILHIDFNSYFASVEQQANPFLRDRSIGIGGKPGGKGIVAAPSMQAKARGIKTAMSAYEASAIDQTLVLLNGDGRKYSEMTDRLLAILERFSDQIEQTSIDEAYLDITGTTKDWLDALAVALEIRDAVRAEIGPVVTISIGIASNKLMAKMGSDAEKPNGLTLIYPEDAQLFLNTRTLSDVPGIGRAILRRLKELGIHTMPQLRAASRQELIAQFKQHGDFLYNAARGEHNEAVCPEERAPQSIGHSYTLPHHSANPRVIHDTLLALSDRVATRLRKHNLSAKYITAHVRFPSLKFISKRIPLSGPTDDGLELFRAAWSAVEPLLESQSLRLVGLTAHDLVPATSQYLLSLKLQKQQNAASALDQLQQRYGKGIWTRASLVETRLKERASGLHFDHKL